jgi:glycosyltransferase involved in cell wall biosynthesis
LDLVTAWKHVSPQGWKLIICGPDDRGHLEEVRTAAITAGLIESLEFKEPAYGEAKDGLLRDTDLFLLPSFSENYSNSVAEALAYGIPVITTRGTPWSEIQAHRCGWWVEIGVPSLTAALREATCASPEALAEMGSRGRTLMLSKPNWPKVAEMMTGVYKWILGIGPRPGFVQLTEQNDQSEPASAC